MKRFQKSCLEDRQLNSLPVNQDETGEHRNGKSNTDGDCGPACYCVREHTSQEKVQK